MTSQYRECSRCKSISVFVNNFKNGVYAFKCLECKYEFLGYDKELKEELSK